MLQKRGLNEDCIVQRDVTYPAANRNEDLTLDFGGRFQPDLTEIVAPLTAKTSKTAKKIFLQVLRLSFSPDHTLDSILDTSYTLPSSKMSQKIFAVFEVFAVQI